MVTTHREEYIDRIADELTKSAIPRSTIKRIVGREITEIMPGQLAAKPMYGLEADNRKLAKKVGALALDLLRSISDASAEGCNALFTIASQRHQPKWPNVDQRIVTTIRTELLSHLEDIRAASVIVLDKQSHVGDHDNRDGDKQICAGAALDLIVGLDAGRPTNSSEGSPIRRIASLLFQVTLPDRLKEWRREGRNRWNEEPDLRQQCTEVAETWRKMLAESQQAHIERLRSRWGLQE